MPLDGCLVVRAVHALDLSVRPRILGFGQPLVDVVASGDIQISTPTMTSNPVALRSVAVDKNEA
jgi:hypothetical protein